MSSSTYQSTCGRGGRRTGNPVVVRHRAGPDAYVRVPPEIAALGVSPAVFEIAHQKIPAGDIARPANASTF
jgi:hypothetical protein